MRNHVNIIINNDKIDSLVGKLFLIRMIDDHPDITLAKMKINIVAESHAKYDAIPDYDYAHEHGEPGVAIAY